ncbi:MAG: hypothetical protein PHW63_08970 [Alphaproteobacteria bacterium]|nr:hypothetical protein [Alphaproteobacteria bacterium]
MTDRNPSRPAREVLAENGIDWDDLPEDPVQKVRRAIEYPGINPEYHKAQIAHLRAAWPTLWLALEELINE